MAQLEAVIREQLRKTDPGIELIPLRPSYNATELRALFPEAATIVAPDFMVTGVGEDVVASDGLLLGTYYGDAGVLNIDHHMPDPRVWHAVSATNQAIAYMNSPSESLGKPTIVITHVDTDSVLSSQILAGILPPDPCFGEAAIAADHTGEPDFIADVLQALERKNSPEYSVMCLMRILNGEDLPSEAQTAYYDRLRQRELAENLARSEFDHMGNGVFFSMSNTPSIPSEFFPPLFPDATIVARATPNHRTRRHTSDPRWNISVRACRQFPPGVSLNLLLTPEDSFGGRWNAGNTARHGGWPGEDPSLFAETLVQRLSSLYPLHHPPV